MPPRDPGDAMKDLAPDPAFTFIDLFAGIGGFHAALAAYGGACEYAVEIDKAAAAVYEQNWRRTALGDITRDANDQQVSVPSSAVLAAGFPCQAFSKSGAQRGMDEARGTLFWNVARVIEANRPTVVLLENVRNLAGPRHIHEWKTIIRTLRELGYRVADTPAVFSPHLLPRDRGGRPQVRERVFITATYNPTGMGSDAVEPVATMKDRIDGWQPTDWDLALGLPLDLTTTSRDATSLPQSACGSTRGTSSSRSCGKSATVSASRGSPCGPTSGC